MSDYETKKEELEDKLYDSDLNLNELIELRLEMNNYDFDDDDIEYADDLINEEIEEIKSEEELKNLKLKFEKLGLNSNFICKMIERMQPIKIEKIELMNQEDLEYLLDEKELTLEQLLYIKKRTKTVPIDEFEEDDLNTQIRENLESIEDVKELNKIKDKMKDLGLDISKIEQLIKINESITINDIQKADSEIIEYLVSYKSLSLEQLLYLRKRMNELDIDEFYIESVDDSIKDCLFVIDDENNLKTIKDKMKDLGLDTKYITDLINGDFEPRINEDIVLGTADAKLIQLPLEVLELARKQCIEDGTSTDIIDKAIKNKKILEKRKSNNSDQNFNNTYDEDSHTIVMENTPAYSNPFDNLMDWEKDAMNNSDYDSSQFEEEEMDEDDYYYEDDKD